MNRPDLAAIEQKLQPVADAQRFADDIFLAKQSLQLVAYARELEQQLERSYGLEGLDLVEELLQQDHHAQKAD